MDALYYLFHTVVSLFCTSFFSFLEEVGVKPPQLSNIDRGYLIAQAILPSSRRRALYFATILNASSPFAHTVTLRLN